MIRTDFPDFLFKPVILTQLESENWNGKIGLVKEWNEKRERFAVQLSYDNSLVWIKPSNLLYFPTPENDEEIKLLEFIIDEKQSEFNFKQGIKLFDQLKNPEKYLQTYLKIFFCDRLLTSVDLDRQNKNCMSQIQEVLKNIIEISCFDDLIVWAKLTLVFSMKMRPTWEARSTIYNLCQSCIESHYGYLPTIFEHIVDNVFRQPSEWEPQNGSREKFQMLQNLYLKSKKMIKNKTFVNVRPMSFLEGTLKFLRISKFFEPRKNMKRETDFLHEALDFLTVSSPGNHYFFLAKILFLEENYEQALENFQHFQEITSANSSNNTRVGTAYKQKTECYIKLGQKSMAKKVFKKLKRFKNMDAYISPILDDLKNRIEAMPNEKHSTCFQPKQKNQNVRTRTKCSSYTCMKIEPSVGAFKHCARCRMTYYCSKKCQKDHWKASHKNECQKY